jgi:hypothetical protein
MVFIGLVTRSAGLRLAGCVGCTHSLPRTLTTMVAARSADLSGMKVAELKEELSRRGLPVSGKKSVLIERLSAQMRPRRVPRSPRRAALPPTNRAAGGGWEAMPARGPALLVVESPAKCATIGKFLGPGYKVLACNGHVRALPSRVGSVRPDEDFAMTFEMVKGAPRLLNAIAANLKNASAIYLATDPDREGEAIAWHLVEALRQKRALRDDMPLHRVAFSGSIRVQPSLDEDTALTPRSSLTSHALLHTPRSLLTHSSPTPSLLTHSSLTPLSLLPPPQRSLRAPCLLR